MKSNPLRIFFLGFLLISVLKLPITTTEVNNNQIISQNSLLNNNKFQQINVSSSFILGAEISSLPQVEDANSEFLVNSSPKDIFNIFEDIGFSSARLRLWNDPSNVAKAVDSYSDLNHTIKLAKRVKSAGWDFLLDFQYSDWWADPGKQNKPKDWENFSFNELKQAIYNFTFSVIQKLYLAGAAPDMVQLGNEISNGFLWPDGKASNFEKFTDLLKSAIKAVNDFNKTKKIPIMLHFAPGKNMSGYKWFLSNLQSQNVSYDIIGLSFYPKWHGTLSNLRDAVNDIAQTYNKDIILVETSYGWTTGWNDGHSNTFWTNSLHDGYPATPTGQRMFLEKVIEIISNIPNDLGKGVFLWEPAWITPSIGGSPMENSALFDFTNNLLEVYYKPLIIRDISITSSISLSEEIQPTSSTIMSNNESTDNIASTPSLLLTDITIILLVYFIFRKLKKFT